MSQQATSQTTAWAPPPGHLGNLTPEQQQTLEQFRKALSSDPNFPWNAQRHTDAYLLRFLRARKFNLDLAKQMIYAAEQWRKDFGVDEIVNHPESLDEEKKEVNKLYPQYYHKIDKDGRPVYVESLSQLSANINTIFQKHEQERVLKMLVLEYERFLSERLPAASEEVGHPVETSCTILDLKGVGVGGFYKVQGYVAQASKIGQDYYPETMGKFYIINAPWLFGTIWGIVSKFLDPVTVAKIKIFSGQSEWAPALKQQIPVENLPAEYLGVCMCDGEGQERRLFNDGLRGLTTEFYLNKDYHELVSSLGRYSGSNKCSNVCPQTKDTTVASYRCLEEIMASRRGEAIAPLLLRSRDLASYTPYYPIS
ncbi:9012_t:CDS:2, partial [Acaulospora colombiana]